jgi:signal transduction histidine kinase
MEKVMGRTYGEFHSLDDTKEFVGKLEDVFETGQAIQQEHRSSRDDRYFLRTLSPIQGPDGSTTSVMVVSKDITEFKEAEEDLRQTNEELSREQSQRKILSKRLIDLLENDRRQISRELHDHVGQILTSLKIDIEMIHGKLKPEYRDLAARITAAQEKTIQAIRDVKNISRGLRPGMLDALGLLPSLRELFSEIQRQTDIEIHFFRRNIPKRIAPEKELAIYRITQEALTNVIKHARAKEVFVNLIRKEKNISLSIEDDGVGFNPDKTMKGMKRKGPLGLLIMQERAIQADGNFTLESQIGKGTHVLVEIPI